MKVDIKLFYDEYGVLNVNCNKNEVPFLNKMSNLVYVLKFYTPYSPYEASTNNGYSVQATFQKPDNTLSRMYALAPTGITERVNGKTYYEYVYELEDSILQVAQPGKYNKLEVSFSIYNGSQINEVVLNTSAYTFNCIYAVVVKNQPTIPLIDNENIRNYQKSYDIALSEKATTSSVNQLESNLGTHIQESETRFTSIESDINNLKAQDQDIINNFNDIVNNILNEQIGDLGITYVSGVLNETEVLNLCFTQPNGRYNIVSEMYGVEIVIIQQQENERDPLYKRMTGGFDYTYDTLIGDWVIASGGGGGGGPTTTMLFAPVGSTQITTAKGSETILNVNFRASIGSKGTLQVYVNGALKSSLNITNGRNEVNITEYATQNENEVKLIANDTSGNSAEIIYLVSFIELSLRSNFDDRTPRSGTFNIVYTPIGGNDITKYITTKLDGVQYGDIEETKVNNISRTLTLSNLNHGVHKIEIEMQANINGTIVKSNTLVFNVMYYVSGNNQVLIASSFNTQEVIQGELISIDYTFYNPSSNTSTVKLYINNTLQNTLEQENGKRYFFNTFDYPLGNQIFKIEVANTFKEFNINVLQSDVNVEPIEENLQLDLNANNRSNDEPLETRNKWIFNDIETTLVDFNYASNGWLTDESNVSMLRFNGRAKTTIPFHIFSENFFEKGKTIEFEFKAKNVQNVDNVLISCLSNNRGFVITSNSCVLKSNERTIEVKFKEEEKTKISFVIQKNSKNNLIKVLINGIVSGLTQYTNTDTFKQTTPLGISINNNGGEIDIYSIRVYDTDLEDTQVLNNYIADMPLKDKKLAINRNNIIDTNTQLVSYNKIKSLIPVLTITGEMPISKGNKKIVNVTYEDPKDSNNNFAYENVSIDIQGTSSQYYPRKNYKIKFNEKFRFYENAIPEKTYTFKADYMESSHSHNTGNAILLNQFSPTFPTQVENENTRNSIYGFPISIFHKPNENATPIYYGIFNFNNDKGNSNTLGLTTDLAESWELKNNTSLRCNFKTSDFSGDVTEDFEARYPDEYEDNPNYTNLQRVVSWLASFYDLENNVLKDDTDSITRFKNEIPQYFDLDFCKYYYIMLDVMLAVDSRAKNMFLDTVDGNIWYPRWYDIDTTYGLDNEGNLRFSYGYEQDDFIGNIAVYNGHESVLWNMFGKAFETEIKDYYNYLRNTKGLSYETMLEVLKEHQIDKISETMYNTDGEFKYVGPIIEDNDATYIYAEQGSRLSHLQWWLKNRFNYLDSKYDYADYKEDFISMRTYTPSQYSGVAPTKSFTITPFTDMYVEVLFGSSLIKNRAKKNTPITLTAPSNITFNNTETIIYGASNILDIGDLSSKYARTMDFSKAKKLKQLIIGSSGSYNNSNLSTLTIGNLTLLEKIVVTNCSNLSGNLDLSGCNNIREIYANGTQLTNIQLGNGGNLVKIEAPETLTSLTLKNQPFFTTFSSSGNSITRLTIENCPNYPSKFIVSKNMVSLENIRLININWLLENNEQSLIENLIGKHGIGANDEYVDKPIITGSVHIKGTVITYDLNLWREYFGSGLTITCDNEDPGIRVDFINYDNSLLYVDYVLAGKLASYKGGTPTRPDDPNGYSYRFYSWDKSLSNTILQPTTFKALYISNQPTKFIYRQAAHNVSNSLTITNLNSNGGYIDWGDGVSETFESLNSIYSTNSVTKEEGYLSANDYEITILNNITGPSASFGMPYFHKESQEANIIRINEIQDGVGSYGLNYGTYESGYTPKIRSILKVPETAKSFVLSTGDNARQLFTLHVPKQCTFSNTSRMQNLTMVLYSGSEQDKAKNIVSDEILDNALWYYNIAKEDFEEKSLNNFDYIKFNNYVLLKKYNGTSTELDLNQFEDGEILGIFDGAFKNCSSITSLKIPSSVNVMEEGCLNGLSNLQYLELPFTYSIRKQKISYYTSARAYACNLFGTEEYPNTKKYSFSGYYYYIPLSLQTVKINDFVSEYDCYGLQSLEEVILPNNTTDLCESSFIDTNVTNITIPHSVERMSWRSFRGSITNAYYDGTFNDLLNIDIYGNWSNTGQSEGTFIKATNLYIKNDNNEYTLLNTNVFEIPEGIETLKPFQFFRLTNIITLYLPNSLKVIKNMALFFDKTNVYYNGSMLEYCNIIIEGKLNSILSSNSNNFYYKNNGQYVLINNTFTLPSGLTKVNDIIFSNFSFYNLTIPEGVEIIGNRSFYNNEKLVYLHLPNSLVEIQEEAFYSCDKLTTLTLGNNITKIGKNAFSSCYELNTITLSSDAIEFGESVFSSSSKIKIIYFNNTIDKWFNMSFVNGSSNPMYHGVTSFFAKVDNVYTAISSITTPSNITNISQYMFYNAKFLTEFIISDNIVSVERDAFRLCTNLQNFTIGKNVNNFSSSCFYAANITNLYYDNTLENWCFIEFDYNSNPVNVASHFYLRDSNNEYYELTDLVLPRSITQLSQYTFSGLKTLRSVYIPNTFLNIGDRSGFFTYCSNLTTAEFEEGTQNIPASIFNNCTNLTNLTIPSTIMTIGSRAFNDCDSLTSITIPSSVVSIGEYAFYTSSNTTNKLSITMLSEMPPTAGTSLFNDNNLLEIIVPSSSVELYKTATNWSTYADKIKSA